MTTLRLGTRESPLELRPGETDRFYWLFADVLAEGDELTGTPIVTSSGPAANNVARNSQPITPPGGEEQPINTVVYADVSLILAGDIAELSCAASTVSGRDLEASLWITGVDHYSA